MGYNLNPLTQYLFYPSAGLLILIIGALSILHFYWARGGEWGFYEALPTDLNGERLFTPKKIHSGSVGFGLLLIVVFLILLGTGAWRASSANFSNYNFFSFLRRHFGLWHLISFVLALVFMLRAIGDFKYVGFFKKIKTTKFGRRDTKWYSPLCILIAILFFLVLISLPVITFFWGIF